MGARLSQAPDSLSPLIPDYLSMYLLSKTTFHFQARWFFTDNQAPPYALKII